MDYDVIYKGTIIANVEAGSAKQADRQAKAIYGPEVRTEPTLCASRE